MSRLMVEFQPMQREYGRLNLTITIMSKRDTRSLIEKRSSAAGMIRASTPSRQSGDEAYPQERFSPLFTSLA